MIRWARAAAALLLAAVVFALGVTIGRGRDSPPDPGPLAAGEELWESLPPELLAEVIESKREQIAELQDDIERIRGIQGKACTSPAADDIKDK